MSVYETIRANMIEGVDNVLACKKPRYKSKCVPPVMVLRYMEKLGYEQTSFEQNGWQYDWWIKFEKKGSKSFTAFGQGYDGSFEFYETEED